MNRRFIGVYDYTVILTYMSLISAGLGIYISLSGPGHPYIGTFFLLACGLFDAFDGMVARTKKDRTEAEKRFGVQIDSLTDLAAFGVLPMCIGQAMIRTSTTLRDIFFPDYFTTGKVVHWICTGLMVFYVLAAMIRLAYFNVTEEMRMEAEGGKRKFYEGLPVTSAAVIFPTIMMFQYVLPMDITIVYFPVILITGVLFISRIRIPKPGLRGILILVGIGILDFIFMILAKNLFFT